MASFALASGRLTRLRRPAIQRQIAVVPRLARVAEAAARHAAPGTDTFAASRSLAVDRVHAASADGNGSIERRQALPLHPRCSTLSRPKRLQARTHLGGVIAGSTALQGVRLTSEPILNAAAEVGWTATRHSRREVVNTATRVPVALRLYQCFLELIEGNRWGLAGCSRFSSRAGGSAGITSAQSVASARRAGTAVRVIRGVLSGLTA